MLRLSNSGETIVEVLIVIMVLGSVLTSAFLVTRQATGANQTAQERTEATEYAQGQIERLRTYLARNSATLLPSSFCFDEASPTGDGLLAASEGSPNCGSTVSNGRYKSYMQKPVVNNVFLETTVWPNAQAGYSTVTLYYKPSN